MYLIKQPVEENKKLSFNIFVGLFRFKLLRENVFPFIDEYKKAKRKNCKTYLL